LYINIQSNIFHNSQEVEVTQVSDGKSMDKQNVVCTYNRILTLKRKESPTHATMEMNSKDIILSEISLSPEDTPWFHP
jgi:hypothetical protein